MQLIRKQLYFFWETQKNLVIGVSVIFILFVLFILGNLIGHKNVSISTIHDNKKAIEQTTQQVSQAPSIYFESYKNTSVLPTVPQNIYSYTFKSNYSRADTINFAKKLGISAIKQTNTDYIIGSNITDKLHMGIFTMNKTTGAFTYQAFGIVKPATYLPSQPVQVEALSYLKELGVADQTVSCPITYKSTSLDAKDLTFVECHRDWSKLGLPLVSLPGTLNIPISQSLTSLTLGGVNENSPNDTSIINVTGVQNAEKKARPTDYNSATLGITQDGRILSINSNLRQIQQVKVQHAQNLKTPQDALQEIYKHKATLSLTLPAGTGMVDWGKVYQDNKAQARAATITDISLLYLENQNDQPQTNLVPSYLIRGYATLSTGFTVNFVQMVPARKDNQTFITLSHSSQAVAGVQTESNDQLHIKAFTPTVTSDTPQPTSTNSKQNPTPTPSQPTSPPFTCFDRDNIKNAYINEIKLTVPGMGTLIVATANGSVSHVFYYRSSSFPVTSMDDVRNAFFKVVIEQFKINVARYISQNHSPQINSIDQAKSLFSHINGSSCPFKDYGNPLTAPIYDCDSNINMKYADPITIAVAKAIIDAMNSNQINSLASQSNYFPNETLSNFRHVLIPTSESSGSATNGSCYITGTSPSLFLYPTKTQKIVITLPTSTSYTDPESIKNIWNLTAFTNGILKINNKTVKHLYYEFSNHLVLDYPKYGYTARYDSWNKTVNDIANKLKLTQNETDQLKQEVKNTLYGKVKTNYLQIYVANEAELNKKLPLIFSTKPQTFRRIHLLLQLINSYQKVEEPKLTSINRKGFTVVEVGAHIKN